MRYSVQEPDAFRHMLDLLPQIVWVSDAAGAVEYVNAQWVDYTGHSVEASLGSQLTMFMHREDRAAVIAKWQSAMATHRPFDVEVRLRRVDGGYAWFLAHCRPILIGRAPEKPPAENLRETNDGRANGAGMPEVGMQEVDARQAGEDVRWLGTATHIDRQRAAEAQLRALNEHLEQRVEERTQELERSNQELDRFAYVASHDLKAPLRAIEHLAAWIAEDAGELLPPASVEHLIKMRGRITRMESLLDDLLTYSRAGRVRGDASKVVTHKLLQGVIETVAPPQGFVITFPDDLPELVTYRAPLETVFRNLLGNAIKHHPQATGCIQIECSDGGDFVEFCVRDDGDGIAPEFHERIFEMFQTLRPRDHVEGSGIGLAVVKKIVESAGGTIRVESAAGKGSTFCFTWPKMWPE